MERYFWLNRNRWDTRVNCVKRWKLHERTVLADLGSFSACRSNLIKNGTSWTLIPSWRAADSAMPSITNLHADPTKLEQHVVDHGAFSACRAKPTASVTSWHLDFPPKKLLPYYGLTTQWCTILFIGVRKNSLWQARTDAYATIWPLLPSLAEAETLNTIPNLPWSQDLKQCTIHEHTYWCLASKPKTTFASPMHREHSLHVCDARSQLGHTFRHVSHVALAQNLNFKCQDQL